MIIEKRSLLKTSLFYGTLTLVCAFVYFLINQKGNLLFPNIVQVTSNIEKPSNHSTLFHFLLALVFIIIATRLMGFVSKKMGQPPVIGEIMGGILLGPSFLGLFFPQIMAYVFPVNVIPMINTIAQLGIILYMYFVGLEIDLTTLKKSAHTTIAISHASIVFPFLLGAGLSLYLYDFMAPPNVSFTSFSLFLGVSLSVTAFPVLARILTDQKLHKTQLGSLALTCAAIDDVTAWCLLAFVTSFAQAKLSNAFMTLLWTAVFIGFMLLVAMPFVKKQLSLSEKNQNDSVMMVILTTIFVSSAFTEYIGIHALFGAFLLGAITPKENKIVVKLDAKLHDVICFLLLPAFFVFTGMRTEINLLNEPADWVLCIIIIALAVLGKFGGTFVAARFSGLSLRNSVGLGILMNTRGLVELIVLNIGLDLGIISQRLFTMLVIMALVTTVMTGPALRLMKGFDDEADKLS